MTLTTVSGLIFTRISSLRTVPTATASSTVLPFARCYPAFKARLIFVLVICLSTHKERSTPTTLFEHLFQQIHFMQHVCVLIGNCVQFFINHEVICPELVMNVFIVGLNFMQLL
jgi:hypothetical protein